MTKKICSLLIFISFWHLSYSQSHEDSLYIRRIIQSEIKLRFKQQKRIIPVFEKSAISENRFKSDSLYPLFYLGKEIDWKSFPIQSDYAVFTTDPQVDSCLYIHTPVFNLNSDEFVIRFETRFKNGISYFTSDYYLLKKRKWRYKSSIRSFSF